MKTANLKTENRDRKRKKIRAEISGTADRPRLSVFKSNSAIYAQMINDDSGVTIVAASSKEAKGADKAKEVGLLIGKRAMDKNITKAVFDRGGYIYAGQVKAIAEGAREAGLNF